MSRRLADLRLAVMMLDGIELHGRTNIVALGITTEGVKIPLGLWEGIDRERDRRDRAAVRPGRPRPGSRAGDAVRDRRRPRRSECSRELRVRASDRPDPRAAEKESAVMCSTQRTDGAPSRLRGRVCGAGQPRGGSVARAVAGGRGAGAAGRVRSVGAAGATVRQRGTGAARWCAGAGAHGGVHGPVGAVADRRACASVRA